MTNRVLHVLIADDVRLNQQWLKSMLTRLGHKGMVVSDGSQALKCMASFKFDVVLMDVMMPVMDGLDALKALRASEKLTGAHLPVIMVTGQTEPGDWERMQRYGADGYLPKPASLAQLENEMNRVINAL